MDDKKLFFGFLGFIYSEAITDMIILVFSSILLFNAIKKYNHKDEDLLDKEAI